MAPSLIEMQEGTLVTEKIPAVLMQQYVHKGHHLYINNYYMSLTQYFIEIVPISLELSETIGKTFLQSSGSQFEHRRGCILQSW